MFSSKTITRRVVITGKNVTMVNGKVIVDGKEVETGDDKNIVFEITGNVERLEVDVCSTITVTGNTGPITTHMGDIDVGGDVAGSVSTSQGDIKVKGAVTGNATTNMGDIDIDGTLGGSAHTNMGDVKHK